MELDSGTMISQTYEKNFLLLALLSRDWLLQQTMARRNNSTTCWRDLVLANVYNYYQNGLWVMLTQPNAYLFI